MPASTVPISRPASSTSGSIVDASVPVHNEAHSTGISWAAVIGGAFVSASLSLILLALGTGLGFTAISPLSGATGSATASISILTIGRAAIAWLIFTQIIAAALGGYLAGRLRTKWVDVHTDEVYFRDTAHGLLVWAVGLVVTAVFLGSAATSLAGGTAQRNSTGTASAASDASPLNPNAYLIDTLFRPGTPAAERQASERNDASARSQAERIFAHGLREGELSGADSTYLAQLVAASTGISLADADKRVGDAFDEARSNAEKTRKALAHLSLWLFIALLAGAFCASYAGTIGGRQRDHVRNNVTV
jgi:hypothetical protein